MGLDLLEEISCYFYLLSGFLIFLLYLVLVF